MSQSLSAVYIHIVFSTKDRIPFINENIRMRLWNYLGGICDSAGVQVLQIGGMDDHVHICCQLPRNMELHYLVGILKINSAKWIKNTFPEYNTFAWQNGYGVFSVNPTECDKVVAYIKNQPSHHDKRDFCDELRLFLKKYHIDYDEKYLWK